MDKVFTGKFMLEWFEEQRETLSMNGCHIIDLLCDPTAWWIEPTVFISFETPNYFGQIETTVDGRVTCMGYPKRDELFELAEHCLCLDEAALEYRKKDWYGGDMNDVNWKPEYQIKTKEDYAEIFEPFMQRLIVPEINQP